MHGILVILGWVAVLFLALVAVLLLLKRETGLRLIQHRAELLPQAMLVRYVAAAVLALVAVWIGAPRLLFAVMLMIAIVGFGDAYVYRRAGHPFWMHLGVGGGAALGALIAVFNFGGSA